MAKISDKIKQLGLDDYYVVTQSTDLQRTPIVEGKKYSLGRFNGAGLKKHYVELYKKATIDGIKPTVAIHVYQDARRSETGIRIQSTEVTYWLLSPTEDFDIIYADTEVGATTDSEKQYSETFIPSKGYLISWNKENQKWDFYGYEEDDSTSLVAELTHIKALDVTKIKGKSKEVYWHANIATSPDVEDSTEGGVEITDGLYEGRRVMNIERALFTSIGDVFAFDSASTSHH